MKYRKVFGVGAGDPVDCAQLAHAVGGAHGAESIDTGITVCGIRCVKFVTAADPTKVRVIADCIVDWKGEISRYAEYVAYADIVQSRENMLDDSLGHDGLRAEAIVESV